MTITAKNMVDQPEQAHFRVYKLPRDLRVGDRVGCDPRMLSTKLSGSSLRHTATATVTQDDGFHRRLQLDDGQEIVIDVDYVAEHAPCALWELAPNPEPEATTPKADHPWGEMPSHPCMRQETICGGITRDTVIDALGMLGLGMPLMVLVNAHTVLQVAKFQREDIMSARNGLLIQRTAQVTVEGVPWTIVPREVLPDNQLRVFSSLGELLIVNFV